MSRASYVLGLIGVVALGASAGAACSASDDTSGFGTGGNGEGAGSATSGNPSGGGFNPVSSGAGGNKPGDCASGATEDKDKDGFTVADGDCNDCDPNVNPGAVEVIVTDPSADGGVPVPADEDCDGMIDNAAPVCDDGIAYDDTDPKNGARAIDLCQEAVGKKWGVESAQYVRADGTPFAANLQVAIFDAFGPNVNVQLGKRMLALSSGYARLPGQPNACTSQTCTTSALATAPPNFPAVVPNCAGASEIYDDIGLELKVRVPTNATGYKFNFKFYSFEFAEWVCTDYNDQFIALVNPPPMGAQNGNIVFDSMNNPVSVNIAFFDVCDPAQNSDFGLECNNLGTGSPCPPQPNPYCPSGAADLQGNGFDNAFGSFEDAGATSWLQTTAPVDPASEITIRFAIWDTGDQAWDSTVLVDGFQWIANGGTVGVGTVPDPDPK